MSARVGGAHVDVDMKFDEKSLDQVGKQIHRQLSKLSKSMVAVGERNGEIYRSIGQNAVTAWRSLLGTIVTGAPLIGSAISGVAGAATLLAGSLYSVVQSGYAVAPILTSIGVAAGTAFLGFKSFFSALKSGDLSGLTPSARSAAEAVQGLSDAWARVRDTVQENIFKGLSDDIARLSTTLLPVLERGLGKMGTALNGLIQNILDYVNSAAGLKVINRFLDNSAEIFTRLSGAVVPFLDGFLRLMNALSPAAERLADRITDIATRFQEWTKGEGFAKRIDDMMKGAEKTAGLLFKVLGNLGSAIVNIFNIANPSTNQFLQMLVNLTQRFEDFTNSASGKNAIAEWAANAVDIMRQFGHTIEAVFDVVAELADPRVIISFLKTVEGAFKILAKLPLDKIVNAFVTVSEALQPVSSLFLAITIAGVSLNILLGSLIGQVGGLFAIFAKIVKFKILVNILKGVGGGGAAAEAGVAGAAAKSGLLARAWDFLVRIATKIKSLFTGVVGAFSKTSAATGEAAAGASRLSKFFGPILSIFTRLAKFAGPVGIAIWIGSLIAKSKELQEKLGGVWEAIKGAFGDLMGAFKEIGTALKPLMPVAKGVGNAFGFVFGVIDKIATFALGVLFDMWKYAFESLGNVFKGVGKIIAGLINILIGLFTLDFGKVWDGLKQLASGIGPLLKGAFGLFVTFFAPARLAKIGVGALKGLFTGLKAAMPAILQGIGTFLVNVLKFFVTLTPRLLVLGGQALVALGKGIVKYTPKILGFVAKITAGVIKWIAKLPGRLLSLGISMITKLAGAVVKNAPKVIQGAAKIQSGVIQWIAKLPGRLLDLGIQAVTKLASAVKTGVGKLKTVAGDIVEGVVNIIRSLPGKLLNLAGDLLNAGKSLGGKILEGIKNGLTAIGDMASSVARSLKDGINKAIGLPKDLTISVLGKKIGFTIPGFAKGGVAPGGMALVGEEGPELVNLPRGSRVYSNPQSQKMMGGGLPDKIVLSIGGRDFIAFVSEIADDRVNAADNLAWQGA